MSIGSSGASPVRRRRSVVVDSTKFRASMSSISCLERCASVDSTSFGGMRPTFRRLRTSRRCPSMLVKASSSTWTDARAVTTDQYARVISSFRSAWAAVLTQRIGLRARGALERIHPAARVDRPLQVHARAEIVRHVGVQHARLTSRTRHRELGHMIGARVARLQRYQRLRGCVPRVGGRLRCVTPRVDFREAVARLHASRDRIVQASGESCPERRRGQRCTPPTESQ